MGLLGQTELEKHKEAVKHGVRARQQAEAVVDLIDVPKELKYKRIFAKTLLDLLGITDADELEAKKEANKRRKEYPRLRATKLNFGKHKDQAYEDVPLSYLDWLCGQMETDLASLQEYLKHPETKRTRSGEIDD